MTAKTEAEQTTPTRYRVTAAYVTCKVTGMAGFIPGRSAASGMIVGFPRDSLLPDTADPATIERLLRRSYIEEVSP